MLTDIPDDIPAHELRARMVGVLEDMLARVERGEIRSIAVSAIDRKRQSLSCWVGFGSYIERLGAHEIVKQTLIRQAEADGIR